MRFFREGWTQTLGVLQSPRHYEFKFNTMKKLSLESLKLEGSDVLQRNHLKTVYGGGYNDCKHDPSCGYMGCREGFSFQNPSGYCSNCCNF